MLARLWAGFLLVAALLAACDSAPDDSPDDAVRQRLVGTWLREYEEGGTRVRRVLVLGQDGSFREASRVVAAGPDTARSHTGAGAWLYDGTNLKRKYSRIDGKALSAPTLPYATFAVSFTSRNEFVGIDHVRGIEVRYERVEDQIEP